jgi:hypothetical protein
MPYVRYAWYSLGEGQWVEWSNVVAAHHPTHVPLPVQLGHLVRWHATCLVQRVNILCDDYQYEYQLIDTIQYVDLKLETCECDMSLQHLDHVRYRYTCAMSDTDSQNCAEILTFDTVDRSVVHLSCNTS